MKRILKLSGLRLIVLALLAAWVLPPFIGIGHAYATLQPRSIDIHTSIGGAITNHTFSFSFAVPVSVASLQFEYCTDPIDGVVCDAPNGLDVSAATLDSQTGQTGFSVLSSSPNRLILTRTGATGDTLLNTYDFGTIRNPSDIGAFFVRISAYPTADASGAYDAFSSVAASITTGININTEVPPILYFCSAVTIPTNCEDANGDFIDFGILTPNDVRYGTSQFLVGTNAPNGYSVVTNGPTMTSGTDQISALTPTGPSRNGKSQFGINLRANLAPLVGADMVGGSGSVMANYNTPNQFHYTDGDIVASGPGPTDIAIFTASYIVNIKSTQPPGIYNTTITYLCTAGF
jgi:hypothetical protein